MKVFISYAREDIDTAEKLYNDLKVAGMTPWLDGYELLPSQNYKQAVNRAIRDSDYFIALFSDNYVNKRGMFQRELNLAFDILEEFPRGATFIIPVRLDDCNLPNEISGKMNIIDLHETSWKSGLEEILQEIQAT